MFWCAPSTGAAAFRMPYSLGLVELKGIPALKESCSAAWAATSLLGDEAGCEGPATVVPSAEPLPFRGLLARAAPLVLLFCGVIALYS
jgi:hypothetical protein